MDLLKLLIRFLLCSTITVSCFLGFAEEEVEGVEPTEVEETESEQPDEAQSQEDKQTNSEESIEYDAENEQESDSEPVVTKPWKRLPGKPLPVGSNVELPQDI